MSEDALRAARRIEEAVTHVAGTVANVEDYVRRLEILFADGYGGNALKLIELLERIQMPSPQVSTKEVPTRPGFYWMRAWNAQYSFRSMNGHWELVELRQLSPATICIYSIDAPKQWGGYDLSGIKDSFMRDADWIAIPRPSDDAESLRKEMP